MFLSFTKYRLRTLRFCPHESSNVLTYVQKCECVDTKSFLIMTEKRFCADKHG